MTTAPTTEQYVDKAIKCWSKDEMLTRVTASSLHLASQILTLTTKVNTNRVTFAYTVGESATKTTAP